MPFTAARLLALVGGLGIAPERSLISTLRIRTVDEIKVKRWMAELLERGQKPLLENFFPLCVWLGTESGFVVLSSLE